MTGAVAWAPLLPVSAIVGLLAVGLVLVGIAAVRRGRGGLWRMAALAVLALALFNPRWVAKQTEPRSDIAVVVVDNSPSQGVGDRRQQTQAALDKLNAELARFPNLESRVVTVGGTGPGGSGGTDLIGALQSATAEVPAGRLAGAVVITDGQAHDVPADATAGPAVGPVHVLLTGKPGEKDRRVVVDQVPSYGIVGRPIQLGFKVEDHDPGSESGTASARVTLRIDGVEAQSRTVTVGQPSHLTFKLDHGGPTIVELEAAPLPGELSTLNNRAVVTVNGVRDRLRVLLVSGQPHIGERTWRNLLKSDPSVDLVHFTILRPPEKDDFTPIRELALIAFPVQELFEKQLSGFDLIVFDRYVVRHVLPPEYFQNIVDYVRNGGALLLDDGPEFAGIQSLSETALADILPVKPTGRILETKFRPTVTKEGARHPVTDLPKNRGGGPWGPWFRDVEGTASGGEVLMDGPDGAPLLVLSRVGKGRVAQLMSDHIWLWARGYEGGGPHAELIRRLAHWLMKEPELEEESLHAEARNGSLAIERRSLDPAPVDVTVTDPSGKTRKLTLTPGADGRADATLPTDAPGLYKVEDGTHTALAAVGVLNAPELADLRATPEILAPFVKARGGDVRWLADGLPGIRRTEPGRDTSGRNWIGLTANGAHVVTGITQTALMPWWLALTLMLGSLGAAWWREGR